MRKPVNGSKSAASAARDTQTSNRVNLRLSNQDGDAVQISIDDAGPTAKLILKGKLDAEGANAVAAPLAKLSEEKQGLVVDLSGVSFLASVGIRQLITAAKTLTRRGGRLALLKPTQAVDEVLTIAAINSLIPIARNDKDAQAIIAAALG